jgi:hypothetical protein
MDFIYWKSLIGVWVLIPASVNPKTTKLITIIILGTSKNLPKM